MNPLSFLTSFCFASVAFAKNNPFHARKPRDVSEAFHILKSLPQDCYRYVSQAHESKWLLTRVLRCFRTMECTLMNTVTWSQLAKLAT